MSKQVDRPPRNQRPTTAGGSVPPGGYRPASNGTGSATATRTAAGVKSSNAPARAASKSGRSKRIQASGFRHWDRLIMGLGVVAVVGVLWLLSSGQGSPAQSNNPTSMRTTPLPAGALAPDFTLSDTMGREVALSSYRGKVLVLEFMAPWCPRCQEEAPTLNEIARQYKDQGVELLSVSTTPYGKNYENGDTSPITIEDLEWFRDTFKLEFPLLFDKDLAVGPAYGVQYYPFIYVIDAEGKVVGMADNPVSLESIKPLIEQAKASAGTVQGAAR